MSYNWPGNVRELENCIERSVVLSTSQELRVSDFPIEIAIGTPGSITDNTDAGSTIADMERRLIFKTLEANDWNKARTAEILGITARTLRNKLTDYRSQG